MNNENTVRFALEKGYFTCMNDVFKLELRTIEKLTYIALARYADTKNRAWPKYETLAKDVSCSRKRVIKAVKILIEYRLVKKHERPNRTNVYLIYPPEYFSKPSCPDQSSTKTEEKPALQNHAGVTTGHPGDENDDLQSPAAGVTAEHPGGENNTPQAHAGVTPEHSGIEPEPPLECTADTPGVNQGHPISTSTNTRDHFSSTSPSETKEKETLKPNQQDIDAVVKAFKSKGVQVQNTVIRDMLGKYSVMQIKGAIQCTDFTVSRNPLAVINKLLLTGNYVMTAERERPEAPVMQNQERGDEEAIRQMIKSARENLQKKVATPVLT